MNLKTLDELGIRSLSLESTIATATDGNGNTRTRSGQITLADGTTREIAEYRFARDNAETKFLDWRPLPEEIAVLPELTLGGVQMDLTQALVRDAEEGWLGQPPGSLRERLDAFLAGTDIEALYARFEDLLFAWTGAEAIAEGSFTNQLDARHAQVLEQAYGRSFQNPNADQATAWQLTYERLAEGLYASLQAQTHLKPFYEAIVWNYNDMTGRAFGDLAQAETLLDAALDADPERGRALINEFGRLLRGLGLTRDTTYFALREHFTDNGDPALAFAFDAAGKMVQSETEGQPLGITRQLSSFTQAVRAIGNTALYGHGGDDVLYGGTGGARMVGGPGDNVLFGDAGEESLWAHEGNDVLDGGAGNDLLKGGAGDDTYVFRRGSGVDTLEEGGGVDRVFFGGGLTRADIFARRTQAGGYEIGIAGTGDVLRLPVPDAPGGGVELFMFSDGTLLRYTDLFVPTEGDDYLFGAGGDDAIDALGGDDVVASGPGDDALHGGEGNDLLGGEEGNDVLFGDAGDDVLIGGAGDDIMDGGAGDDLLLASEEDRNAALKAWRIQAGRGNGNDTYRFGFGDGHDIIVDSDRRSENMDTILLKEGVTPADVQMAAEGEDMVLRLSGGESLRVKKHYSKDGNTAIERILFADGTVWSGSMLFVPTVIGTPEDDRLNALSYRSTHVIGLDGNDVLYGGKKDDLLEGGGGDDWLFGLDGDDVLRGGMGNDYLEGGAGSDVYDGGAGNDQLREADSTNLHSSGADVFLFGRGDGQDTLVSRRIYAYDWWMTPPSEQYGATEVVDDVLRFKAGVSPDDITVTGVRTQGVRNNWSADARIEIAGDPGSSLRIEGFLNGYNEGTAFKSTVKRFEFADGTVWNFEDIVSRLVWHGTPGDDASLWGSEYDDHIFGYGGDDMISGLWGNDTIEAGDGDDIIHSGNGHSVVFGGDGNDWIDPGDGNDVVDGGAGDDVVSSRYVPWLLYWRNRSPVLREGDLTVMFGHGDGHDVVEITNQRADSNDVIRLKADVAPEDVKLLRVGNDLVLRLPDSGDAMTVRNWFSSVTDADGNVSNPFLVEGIHFEDGTRWGVDEIRAGVLIGTEAEEQILGYADSDDLIEGRAGSDILRGDTGDDTYVFRAGDGQDAIIDATGSDRIRFADRLRGDIQARRIDLNLVLDAGDDRVTIRNWFAPATGGVQTVRFADGSEWDAARLRELVLTGTPGEDTITGYETDDTLAGLAGADVLAGGVGNDSYVYRRGDGRDTLRETDGQDALMLADLLPGDVTLRSEGMDLVVAVIAPPGEEETDAIRVIDWFARNAAMVERIVFADGSALDAEAIRNAANLVTDTDDYLLGTPGNDLIDGKGGNDTILGLDGDDVIRGGTGNDNLQGGAGANEYRMGRGDGFDAIRTTPTRTNVFPGFLEQADLELSQLDSTGGVFLSDYWANESSQGDFYRIPWEIRQPLVELSVGVTTEVARDTLTVMRAWLAGGSDTIVLGEGIAVDDLSVQVGVEYVGGGYEWEGYESPVLAVGFGRDEGFLVTTEQVLDTGEGGGNYTGELSLKRIRFADGSELTLDDMIALAGVGVVGEQYGTWWDDVLVGSVAPDVIHGDGGSDRIDARGQNDIVNGGEGEDVIFGGTGDDVLYGSWDNDVLAGGSGADQLSGDYGDDIYAYNRGDGADRIDNWPGMLSGDNDAISFGGGILETDISAYVTPEGRLILQTGAEGDSLVLDWFDVSSGFSAKQQQTISLAQFIHPDGTVRVYDLAQLVTDLKDDLLAADADNPLRLFDDAADHDVTADWIGDGGPLGGNPALAYALLGDPFAEPQAIYAEAGDDVIVGTALSDTIDAGDGNNVIDSGSGNDEVIAGSGNDTIAAGAGADMIYASEGDDVITGGEGDDFIDAGPGNDRAIGGAGDDYYYFYRGYGSLTIDDLAEPGVGNTLYLDDISPGDITLSTANGELVLRVANDGGEIRLSNFNPADPYARHAVEHYEFSDGTVLTYDELLQLGLNLTGTESSEFLVGADGDDVITGEEGDDLVAGGRGSDTLEGGLGSDTYVFNLGDGEDTLIDRETFFDSNSIQFGPGIDSSQVHLQVEAGDLVLAYGDEGDSIRMPGVRPGDPASGGVPFNLMRFADGSTLPLSDLVARGLEITGTASEDVLNGAIGDDVLHGLEGRDMLAGGPGSDSYTLSPGSGLDVIGDVSDETQSNTLSLDFPDLESLDDLAVSFDPAAGTLTIRISGTGDGAVLTGFDAADPWGSRAIDSIVFAGSGRTFTYAQLLAKGIEIVGTPENDVIVGTTGRDIIRGLEGDDLIVGGTGGDVVEGGAGDDAYVFMRGDGVLTIREEASRSPGNVLIFGEGIEVADIRNNLRFTAPDEAAGTPGWLRIGIASPDGVADEVRIEGFDPNDAEVGEHGVESFLFADGTLLSYRDLVLNTFIVQGDTGDDLLTGTNVQDRLYGFEGNDVLRAGEGNDTLTGGTNDDLLEGGAGADMYVFNRGDGNDVLIDSTAGFDASILAFGAGIEQDDIVFRHEGDDLLIEYGPGDSVRIGNWTAERAGLWELRFDGGGATTIEAAVNAAPVAATLLDGQVAQEDRQFTYTVAADAFGDPEGSELTYGAALANGNALPGWLAFDPLTRSFSGIPENIDVGTLDVVVSASDALGATTGQPLRITVENTNDTPEVAAMIADRQATEDESFAFTVPADAFRDVDAGDVLAYSALIDNGSPLPPWLTFDPATRTFSGTPANEDVGSLALRVSVTDQSGAQASQAFALTVNNVNDAPEAGVVLNDQSVRQGETLTWQIPEGAFTDVDMGDVLTYSVRLADDNALPGWLSFDPATEAFNGTPTDSGRYDIRVTATDLAGAAVSQTFALDVTAGGNQPPLAAPDAVSVTEDRKLIAWGNVLANDLDPEGDPLTVADPGIRRGEYGRLALLPNGGYAYVLDDCSSRVQGLGMGETTVERFGYLADDGEMQSAGELAVTVLGTNDAPELARHLADVQLAKGKAFSWQLPAGSF
ncbi:MAG: calcium-binding protein, partial [Rhodocyclaceae bacterium]